MSGDPIPNDLPLPDKPAIPHVRIVAAVTAFILCAFGGVTAFVLAKGDDPTIIGAVIGVWTSLASGAGGFWLGSSSGGKLAK